MKSVITTVLYYHDGIPSIIVDITETRGTLVHSITRQRVGAIFLSSPR